MVNYREAYALLDYDGFVCKAFYANKENYMDMESATQILKDLSNAALSKVEGYFNTKDVQVIPVMSGHSWKKDIYPSYKRTRKRDEYLGAFREYIKEEFKREIVIGPQLEADEILVCLSDYLTHLKKKFIVFSDDKDLRYYSKNYCKINITEEVQERDFLTNWKEQLEQMIIGDREDNIQGIPKVGEKTAPKLLEACGYNIEGVIRCFKDRGIEIDNCLRDLLLVIPLSQDYITDKELVRDLSREVLYYGEPDELTVNKALIGQIQYLNKVVKDIYDEKN